MKAVFKAPFKSEAQIRAITKILSEYYGCPVRPRGRHSNRKNVLGSMWRPGTQNDIPWKLAETVSFYKLSK